VKIKIGVIGASGRMGQEIQTVISRNEQLENFCAVDRNEEPGAKASEVDVWIDFSSPEALSKNLQWAITNQKAFVCGTTGFSQEHYRLLEKAAEKIPVLWASNMSMGVAVLNEALKAFSAIADFDFQIEEIHHNKKKDRPSGTAITLKQNLEKVLNKSVPETLAIRGGGVFGVHKIFAMSDEEVLTFEHTALNRTVFAKGAVKAATWLVEQKPGLYQIRDVLFGKRN